MKANILIIDDDAKLNQLLIGFLTEFDFKVVAATHPEEGLKKLKQETPDLVILDVMLPGMNGFEVCKKIREFQTVPIIMLTARGEVTDKIVGLELGADDYLPKPFEPRELVARIQSVLRRARGLDQMQIKRFGRLEIDFPKRTARLDGAVLDLTTNEFAALALLVRNPRKVLNRDQILEELGGVEWNAFNRTVDITMSRLRHKLNDDPKTPSFIKTVWGIGYIFIEAEDPEQVDR
ncbi:MAG: response regulator transcription factor [Nitrospirae bacterium]|nr:response regulator transcription factor [Candidatus Manganitrophaceae bacterium]